MAQPSAECAGATIPSSRDPRTANRACPKGWRSRVARSPPRATQSSNGARLRDVAGDAGHRVDDVAREQGKRAEDRDRDDGEDDAVLGHRLPVLTGEPVVELLHRCRPPEVATPDGAPGWLSRHQAESAPTPSPRVVIRIRQKGDGVAGIWRFRTTPGESSSTT